VTAGRIRTVLGDIEGFDGVAYAHEHLVLDSPLIADRFPHILLDDVDAAVAEVGECRAAGAGLMVDTMPVSAGRDVVRLAEISTRTGVPIVAATGLHHDRYYGPLHWTNRVGADELTALFVADLIEGSTSSTTQARSFAAHRTARVSRRSRRRGRFPTPATCATSRRSPRRAWRPAPRCSRTARAAAAGSPRWSCSSPPACPRRRSS